MNGRIGLLGLTALAGCGDSLLGGWEIEQRIGSPQLPPRGSWEVRWAGRDGLTVACERPDADIPEGSLALLGTVQLPTPTLPPPIFQEEAGFRWALALPALVWDDAGYPEAGDESLEPDLGVWGTSAPVGWLAIEGDAAAAGALLRVDGLPASTGWVDVLTEVASGSGRLDGAIGALDPNVETEGLWAIALEWSDDEELDLWSGNALGGIASTCEAP